MVHRHLERFKTTALGSAPNSNAKNAGRFFLSHLSARSCHCWESFAQL